VTCTHRPWAAFEEHELCAQPTVFATDPGGVTGWSKMTISREALLDTSLMPWEGIERWEHGQVDHREDERAGVDKLYHVAARWPGAAILQEQFDLRMLSQDPDLLYSVRIIAMFDYALRGLGVCETFRQTPSDAKKESTDDRLKRWGFYVRTGGMGHARDADRHALLMIRKARLPGLKGQVNRRRWWPHLFS
jgi:hypothetical protein